MARMACVVAATATAFRVFLRLEVLDLDPGESIYLFCARTFDSLILRRTHFFLRRTYFRFLYNIQARFRKTGFGSHS